jgi:DNA-binding response OmpR family regulator
VEDNTYVAAALECALSNVGHEVVAAASLREILSRLKDVAPDFVISDYRLAGDKNGFDVIAELRRRFGSNLPAIIITGDTDPAVIRRMAEKGIGVQHKPLDFEALRAHLAELSCSSEG